MGKKGEISKNWRSHLIFLNVSSAKLIYSGQGGFTPPFFYLISCFLGLPLFNVLYIILKIMTFLTTYYFHIMSHLLLVISLTDDQIKASATFGLYLLFNPFVPNAPFLYPLKISEKRNVFWCFKRVKNVGSREVLWVISEPIFRDISKTTEKCGKAIFGARTTQTTYYDKNNFFHVILYCPPLQQLQNIVLY